MRALLSSALVVMGCALAFAAPPTVPENFLGGLAASLPDTLGLDGKVVYVDFWASWCVPCRKSFPWMQSMDEAHADAGLRIVTVNLDAKEKAARKFLDDLHVTLPVVFDPEGKFAEQGHLQTMPTALIFGRDGKLAQRHEGFRDEDPAALEALLTRLLAAEMAE